MSLTILAIPTSRSLLVQQRTGAVADGHPAPVAHRSALVRGERQRLLAQQLSRPAGRGRRCWRRSGGDACKVRRFDGLPVGVDVDVNGVGRNATGCQRRRRRRH